MGQDRHLKLGRDLAVFVLLIVLSAGIMAIERLDDDGVIAGRIAKIFTPFENLSSTVMNLSFIRKENQLLRAKVVAVARENALLREQAGEIGRLYDLLSFKADYPGTLVACRVVRGMGQRMGGGIVLDKGASSGIERNMTVIAPDGLVGLIIGVSGDVCQVKRLVDPGYRVSALTGRTRATGILGTHSAGNILMEWVSPNADVAVGDTVVTSGMGSVAPKGIPLGSIVSVHDRPDKFSLTLDVEPFVDFKSLEEVFVILRRPTGFGALTEEGEVGEAP
jgi:rod shape-determining protein MreC